MQKMKVAGVPAQPPAKWPENLANKPSVEIQGCNSVARSDLCSIWGEKMRMMFLPKGRGARQESNYSRWRMGKGTR